VLASDSDSVDADVGMETVREVELVEEFGVCADVVPEFVFLDFGVG
jgi:hypothetical protein